MSKPEVGQIVYAFENRRSKQDDELVPWTVTEVGNEFYTIATQNGHDTREAQFRIVDNMERTDFCPIWMVYFSKQEYYDRQEHIRRFGQLNMYFWWHKCWKYTVDQLRQMCRILGLDNGEPDYTEGG